MGPDQAFRSQVAASLQSFLSLMIRAVSLLKSSEGSRVFWAMLRAVLSVIYSQAHEQISTRFSAFKKAYVS